MPSTAEKHAAFQRLHTRPGAFVIPNPWNAGTARVLTTMGFEALATTSAGLAFSVGRRDSAGALTREEVLANAREIVDATQVPVSADLEGGFGAAPEACAETVRLAARVGWWAGPSRTPPAKQTRPSSTSRSRSSGWWRRPRRHAGCPSC